jgi:hypothetical protein
VPAGPRLQEMKLNAIATRIALRRMLPYTRRQTHSQLCAIALALTLVALPLASIETPRVPILTPLATDLVPLDSSLQSQPGCLLFQLPSGVAPVRLVLGYLDSLERLFNPTTRSMVHLTVLGCSDSSAMDTPHGRSPPALNFA